MTNNHYTDCAIDIETLDVEPTAVILSVGLCFFNCLDDPDSEINTYHFCLDATTEQQDRSTSLSTIDFWRKQDNKTWEDTALAPAEDQFSRAQIHAELNKIFRVFTGCLWAKDPNFDLIILKDYFGGSQHMPPHMPSFLNWRSVRTVRDIAFMTDTSFDWYKATHGGNAQVHHAMADAKFEARQVQTYFKALQLGLSHQTGPVNFGGR